MKDTLKDATTDAMLSPDFPRTADLRVYHLGLKAGEVANRIITVGSPSRTRTIAAYLDSTPKPFHLESERGFTTITGRYKGIPISIVSIGMGYPNMDFFVREVRECIDGDMAVIRLGSCGALIDVPVGSIVVPKASVAVSRNYDFDFVHPENSKDEPYFISKPAAADALLSSELVKALNKTKPYTISTSVVSDCLNASADSFYSSQGRQTSFPDHNVGLIKRLKSTIDNLATFEMETYHLLHLAVSWGGRESARNETPPPLATNAVKPLVHGNGSHATSCQEAIPNSAKKEGVIRAAAAHMVFASRESQDFITPEMVEAVESWSGKAVLEALISVDIPENHLHEAKGSVWDLSRS